MVKSKLLAITLFFIIIALATNAGSISNTLSISNQDSISTLSNTDHTFVPEEVIIKFNHALPLTKQKNIIQSHGGTILDNNEKLRATLVKTKTPSLFMKSISQSSLVQYAERNLRVTLFTTPNDEHWDYQWNLKKIGCPQAWNVEQGTTFIKAAVIDSGIDYQHPDINQHYLPWGYDWADKDADPIDDFGHGTHCAGIISSVINNAEGIAGIAQVGIIAERVLDGPRGTAFAIASGIQHAADLGVRVISLSLGMGSSSEYVEDACDYAFNEDIVLVGAAGNDNSNAESYPAAYDTVIAVAATDEEDKKASFSNYGSWIDVAAPGKDILSLRAEEATMDDPSSVVDEQYYISSGTSMACPHVAGLAALILSRNPSLTNMEVKSLIKRCVDAYESDRNLGTGRINVSKVMINTTEDYTNLDPTTPIKPKGPSEGTIFSSYSFTTSSEDPNEDKLRYGWDWDGDYRVDQWTTWYNQGENITISHKWKSPSTYGVHVKAQDRRAATSSWSQAAFITIKHSDNNPPKKPEKPQGTTRGDPDVSYSYSTQVDDPEDDKVRFGWDWNGDKIVDQWTDYQSGEEYCEVSHTWNNKGSYVLHVVAEDEHGAQSAWSDPLIVTMPKTAPCGMSWLETFLRLMPQYSLFFF